MDQPEWLAMVFGAEMLLLVLVLPFQLVVLLATPGVMRWERDLHRLPRERYHAEVSAPVATEGSVAIIGIGIALLVGAGPGLWRWLGIVVLFVGLVALVRYRTMHATGSYPRWPTQAGLRRTLAAVEERLDGDASLSGAEAARLRAQLAHVGRVADRLMRRAGSVRWRDAFRRDPAWRRAVVVAAAALQLLLAAWLVAGVVVGAYLPHSLVLLVILTAAGVAGEVLRVRGYRAGLRMLSAELRADSDALLTRLTQLHPPTATTSRPRSRLRTLLRALARRHPHSGAMAAIAAVAPVLLVAACSEDEPDRVETGDVQDSALVGTEWLVVETSIGGSTTAVPAEVDAVVRFDGEGRWTAHGCNDIGGGVEIEGMRLSFDDDVGSTDIECGDSVMAVDDAITTVLRGAVDAAADGEGLTLTGSDGDRLRLEARDGVFPSRTVTPLEEGGRGEGDYRFGYEVGAAGPHVRWEFRAAPGKPWGSAGSGPPSDPHRPDPLPGSAEEQVAFVFGSIGADVARVVYEPPEGEPTELNLYQLGAELPEWQAYGGFVEQPVAGSYVVAYDAAGAEVGRSVDLLWS